MMTAKNINELGTIDLNRVKATNGRIETFVPVSYTHLTLPTKHPV